MKKIFLLLLLPATIAHADCFLRSTTVSEAKVKIQRQSDVQRDVRLLSDDVLQCTAVFRVMVNNNWFTVQGQSKGSTALGEAQVCAQAQNLGRARFLEQLGGVETSAQQELVCTDQDIPKHKLVNLGDRIRESEVTPDPDAPQSFAWQGMECRRFLETVPYGVGFLQNRGIICRIDDRGTWKVVKKWEHFRG
jgi:hypothetical protein